MCIGGGVGGTEEVLTDAAKGKALCNLGHGKEQLQQAVPARERVPANSLVATPTFLRPGEGAGLGRMFGSALGKSEEGKGG